MGCVARPPSLMKSLIQVINNVTPLYTILESKSQLLYSSDRASHYTMALAPCGKLKLVMSGYRHLNIYWTF